ncbi:MAG: cardiolipin synthase [Planctomycetota bacterium]
MTTGWLTAIASFVAHDVIVVCLIPVVLLRRKEPAATTAWIFAILLMPFIGAIAFLAFGNDRMARRSAMRESRKRQFRGTVRQVVEGHGSPIDMRGQLQLYRLLERINPLPTCVGNHVEIFQDMEKNYARQLAAIAAAKDHVHMEYYIFQTDEIGQRFRDELIAAARRGVQVRFVYDSLGSWSLNRSFLRKMREAGVEVAPFIPLNLLSRRWIFNFRNHRKILVVDADVGFIGGANIGLEYLGKSDVGHWADTHLCVTGPIVSHLQRVFAEDWAFASGQEIQGDHYYRATKSKGKVTAQVVPGGPDQPVPVYRELYFSAVANAVERIRICTPYFVPTEATLLALQTAARRGVDVRVLVPGRSTHYFVKLASESYYDDLLEAGVKIYEIKDGFMHSKVLSIDGRWSVVGTRRTSTTEA